MRCARRAGIAREPTAVAAHQMSLIVVQPESAPYRLPDATSPSHCCHQPGLADIPHLVAQARTSPMVLFGMPFSHSSIRPGSGNDGRCALRYRQAPEMTAHGQGERWQAAGILVQLLRGRWTLDVFAALWTEGHRYQELYEILDGISHKVLTETLRRAERDGLITRRLDRDRIETATLYELTPLGHSLDVPLAALIDWIDAHRDAVQGTREQWDRVRRSRR
jgi:DNA-binding HxlR family transcriptional regulator